MHVLFDVRPLQSASVHRGIGRYVFELLASLARCQPALRFTFLRMRGQPPPRLPAGVSGGWLFYPLPFPEQLRGYADALVLPRLLSRVAADAYHSPEYGLPAKSSVPLVVSVHDLIPWVVPHRSYLRQRVRWFPQVRLLKRARVAACDSDFTRRMLIARHRIDPARTRVVYPGINPAFFGRPDADDVRSIQARFGSGFALLVGECDWRKRPEHAVAAIASMPRLRLVIVGPNRRHTARIGRLAQAAGASDRVTVAGVLTDGELLAAYASACLLLFPSRYEGFGMPVLEAAAVGLPVVAYANSALPEVCGGSLELVPEGDLEAFTARAHTIAANPDGTWDGAAARTRAQAFTWERAAGEVFRIYQEIAG